MNLRDPYQPFGLIFEEIPILELLQLEPVYDDELDLNVIIDENGEKIPCVEYKNALGTKTETKSQGEESDEDYQGMFLGTKTHTFEDKEGTDSDEDHDTFYLGTKTATSVEKEQQDSDDNDYFPQLFYNGTKTATKTSGEDCDSDE